MDDRSVEDTPMSQRLTNDDFRKLLMTPRATPSAGAHPAGSVREAMANAGAMPPPGENKSELRRKKKSYYAALKKQEDSKLAELAEKYRDRARERRDGSADAHPDPAAAAGSAYRAVAPDVKSGMDAKERRRQLIQESKYLGGDMEHTHLVKGLDYALLQKVRSEIVSREQASDATEAELERLADVEPAPAPARATQDAEEEMFQSPMAREIYNLVMEKKSKKVTLNENFAPGRTAYVVSLEEEQELPTTLRRSARDAPPAAPAAPPPPADLLDRLAAIFAYLRPGRHRKGKKNKDKAPEKSRNDDSIYGEIGDYVAERKRDRERPERERERDRERPERERERDRERPERERERDRAADAREERPRSSYFDKPVEVEKEEGPGVSARRSAALLSRLAAEPEGYAECYPGLREMDDAIEDSDDEADYTKMDAGNKKGPIGRWDFDTQEEYSAYMGSKEALPKAAFQYGVKTQDGRRTRKTRDKGERQERDREWQQIQNIIQKRKAPRAGDEPGHKSKKY